IHPEGYLALAGFRQDPFPTWTFEVDGVRLEKIVFMPYGGNTVQVEYRLLQSPAESEPVLEVRPLIAFRDYHATTHENGSLNPAVETTPNAASVQPYASLPRLYFAHNAGQFGNQGYWYRNFFYREEQERGLDSQEDLFNPLVLSWKLARKGSAQIIASTQPRDIQEAAGVRQAEARRREKLVAAAPVDDPLARALAVATDQY